MKQCRACGSLLLLEEFYAHPMMSDGHLNFCKPCVRERIRQHRLLNDHVRDRERARYEAGKKKINTRAFRTPAIARAHNAVRRAIAKGTLVRANQCEECGRGGTIEAAHYDYARPLVVRWLCQRCHRRWDAANPKHKAA